MSFLTQLKFYSNSKNETERQYLTMLAAKTQFAGIEIHKIVIRILKYISNKYLKYFHLTDESQYWESENETLLHENFSRYDTIFNNVSNALQTYPMKASETYEEYFERVLKHAREKDK